MIVFRHADTRFPFLWESEDQPAARWHDDGEGPVQYLSETPDGAWAEFLRHEEITEPSDLEGITRAMWAVDAPESDLPEPALAVDVLTGGPGTYSACRGEARRLRDAGEIGLSAPSAALLPETPSGWRVEGGMQPGAARDERTIVLFGRRPALTGWAACATGRPRTDLLARVRHSV
ncbi:MAG: RES family NAD+ phosphorylase [Actinomycetota bacterium]